MSKRLLIGIALVVMSVSVVGAASYTSATVDREANIGVSADSSAIIGLEPGPVDGVTTTDDRLDIELGQSYGLNEEASFTYGDDGSPASVYAFSITNQDASSHNFELSYSFDSGTDPSSETNVQLEVFDGSGTSQAVADEDTSAGTSIASTTTYYVVITVDTTGVDESEDLSGTVTITATSP